MNATGRLTWPPRRTPVSGEVAAGSCATGTRGTRSGPGGSSLQRFRSCAADRLAATSALTGRSHRQARLRPGSSDDVSGISADASDSAGGASGRQRGRPLGELGRLEANGPSVERRRRSAATPTRRPRRRRRRCSTVAMRRNSRASSRSSRSVGGQLGRAAQAGHVPLAGGVGDVLEVAVAGEHGGAALRTPPGQAGEAVGRVADERRGSRGSTSGGTPNFAITPASSISLPLATVELHDPRRRARTGRGPCPA